VSAVLEDRRFLKAGVNLPSDTSVLFKAGLITGLITSRMQKASNSKPHHYWQGSWFDIGLAARNVLGIPAPGVSFVNQLGNNHGLESLCSVLLPEQAFQKDKAMQMSDWSAEILSSEQQEYAALDAWLACKLANVVFHRCEQTNKRLVSSHI
jgi:hypothetical protein